ncbi:MAG: CCA tRNA nucleotidyltransferase [Spirochaetia bacterium]|nr:CCA tRNA nucleotidyltransferase [Spirochaetia bacterium]
MLKWIKNLFFRGDQSVTDDILKYPVGKRYYPDFHNIRKNYIDIDAQKVIGRLNQFGFKAYIVGGCVRDLLLKRRPKDYDIVTNATPAEVKKIFVNSRLIGKRFRIVHVVFKGNKIIEVATARSLPSSRKGARDESDLLLQRDNEFGTFKEDAARRDFTINSLFFDIRNESIIDYTGGYEDIQNKIVRIIGDENISLPEDPVRMLRAVKFAGILDFEIHENLEKGIRKHKKLIQKASAPRLHEEYNKIFRTGHTFTIFKKMAELGLFDALFPDLAKKNKELYDDWPKSFEDSLMGKSLKISDRMINEHEDINTTIYFAILGAGFMLDLFDTNPRDRGFEREIKSRMEVVSKDLGLTRNESESILQIYNAQRQFYQEESDNKAWVRNFKNKPFFQEAFILYKISVRANNDDAGIQRALFWEIGMRKKLKFAIRKVMNRSIEDSFGGQNQYSAPHGQGQGQGQHRKRFTRRPDKRSERSGHRRSEGQSERPNERE